MKKITPICLILLFVLACTNEKAQIQQLKSEVIKIHDDVMPKSADINRTQRALKTFLKDSTIQVDTQAEILKQLKLLDVADKAMSDWMIAYKAPSADDSFEVAMEHLNNEKVKITKVKELMLGSLESGNQLLTQLKQSTVSKE